MIYRREYDARFEALQSLITRRLNKLTERINDLQAAHIKAKKKD